MGEGEEEEGKGERRLAGHFIITFSEDKQVFTMKGDYINQAVQYLVGEQETNDPYRLARHMGIEVDEHPFERIKGMILDIAGQVTIILIISQGIVIAVVLDI